MITHVYNTRVDILRVYAIVRTLCIRTSSPVGSILCFLCIGYIRTLYVLQWLITKLGSKYILDKTIDGATPLHMAAGIYTYIIHTGHCLCSTC